MTPRKDDASGNGVIGIIAKEDFVPAGPIQAMSESAQMCWNQTKQTVTTIASKIYKHERPDLAGPVGIFQMVRRAAPRAWRSRSSS